MAVKKTGNGSRKHSRIDRTHEVRSSGQVDGIHEGSEQNESILADEDREMLTELGTSTVMDLPPYEKDEDFIPAVAKMQKQLLDAAATLTSGQARYLVDAYYQLQDFRIQAGGQSKASTKNIEPTVFSDWVNEQFWTLERGLKHVLDKYSDQHIVGRWAKSICGVGPVISAGLLAHIDMNQCPTVGHIWNFGGYNPNVKWLGREKSKKLVDEAILALDSEDPLDWLQFLSEKSYRKVETLRKICHMKDDATRFTKASVINGLARRPWNARLKVLFWKIGQSFMKQRSRPNDFYGKLYAQRKALEIARNVSGAYAEIAKATLEEKNFSHGTPTYAAYKAGRLPDGRIELRAERWATKIFLSHWHHVAYRAKFQKDPPKPYVMAILGHVDEIQVPNYPWKVDGTLKPESK